MEKLTNYDTFAIEQYSYFLTRLAETKDLNGKPLLGSPCRFFGGGMCTATVTATPISAARARGRIRPRPAARGGRLRFQSRKAKSFAGYTCSTRTARWPRPHYRICSRPVNPDARLGNLLLLMAQRMGVQIDERLATATRRSRYDPRSRARAHLRAGGVVAAPLPEEQPYRPKPGNSLPSTKHSPIVANSSSSIMPTAARNRCAGLWHVLPERPAPLRHAAVRHRVAITARLRICATSPSAR